MYGSIRPLDIINNAIETMEKKHAGELKALKEEHDAAIFMGKANKAITIVEEMGFKFDPKNLEWVSECAAPTTKIDYVTNSRRPIVKGDLVYVKGYPNHFQVEAVLVKLGLVRVRKILAGAPVDFILKVKPIDLSLIY